MLRGQKNVCSPENLNKYYQQQTTLRIVMAVKLVDGRIAGPQQQT